MKFAQEKVLLGCGVWLIILPFLGFPQVWKDILITVTGVVVTYVGALLYKKFRTRASMMETKTETFTETS
jgi:uncharacterized membrane protein